MESREQLEARNARQHALVRAFSSTHALLHGDLTGSPLSVENVSLTAPDRATGNLVGVFTLSPAPTAVACPADGVAVALRPCPLLVSWGMPHSYSIADAKTSLPSIVNQAEAD